MSGARSGCFSLCLTLGTLLVSSPAVARQQPAVPSPPSPPPEVAEELGPSTVVSGVTVTAQKPTTVTGVTVTGQKPCTVETTPGTPKTAPYVVETFPRDGAVVKPGLLFLRVTFSEAMSRCDAAFAGERAGPPVSLFLGAQQSPDRRSFIYAMVVPPRTDFHFLFGTQFSDREHRSRYGVAPRPHQLSFSTSGERPPTTLSDALKADPHIDQILAEPGEFARLTPPCANGKAGLACQLRTADLRVLRGEDAPSGTPAAPAPPAKAADPQ
jgi:hypothetical protein